MPLLRPRTGALGLALLAGGCALVPEHSDAPAPRIRGPIPSRVQEPIKLGTLAFRPRRAATVAPGKLSLGIESVYSNVFQNGTGVDGQEVVLDGEIWTNTLIATCGVSESTDVELDLGLLYASNGFLDSVIESYHSLFSFPDGGREKRPRDTYEMRAEIGGNTAYTLAPYEIEMLDTPLVLTQRLQEESASSPAIALRAGVDLPTGSESRGAGNGGWDWGAGVLAEKTLGRWTWTAALDWVDAQAPSSFRAAGIDAYDGLDAQLGAEYRWNDRISLLAGLVLTPPVTRDFTISEIDREILGLDVGAAWDVGEHSQLHAGFTEDLMSASGPDISFFLGWRIDL